MLRHSEVIPRAGSSARLAQRLEIDRRRGLSFEEFNASYLRPHRPVVIEGAIDAWPAMARWTPAVFADAYRDRAVKCRNDPRAWTMDSYIAALPDSTPTTPLPYLRNLNIQTDFPDLVADISPPLAFARPDWLSSRLMPKDWPRPRRLNQLFISGRGARITLHYDDWRTHNMVSNIVGEKRFVLFPSTQSDKLYRRGGPETQDDYIISQVDPWAPDRDRFPDFDEAMGAEIVIGRGDTLFVPSGWWHSSFTESTCISVSSSFANWSNWGDVIDEIARLRRSDSAAKRALIVFYLAGVGAALRAMRACGLFF